MPLVNDPDLIKAQYRNGDKLDIRIRLHQKYSLNKEPFGEWIHAHYHLAPGMRVQGDSGHGSTPRRAPC